MKTRAARRKLALESKSTKKVEETQQQVASHLDKVQKVWEKHNNFLNTTVANYVKPHIVNATPTLVSATIKVMLQCLWLKHKYPEVPTSMPYAVDKQ